MAFNTLEPIKIDCPVCDIRSEHQFQFETGADYKGDETGRFCLRFYKVGDKLAWWPSSDARYPLWRQYTENGGDSAKEQIEMTCPNCRSSLIVSLAFESLYIIGVVDVRISVQAEPSRGAADE